MLMIEWAPKPYSNYKGPHIRAGGWDFGFTCGITGSGAPILRFGALEIRDYRARSAGKNKGLGFGFRV